MRGVNGREVGAAAGFSQAPCRGSPGGQFAGILEAPRAGCACGELAGRGGGLCGQRQPGVGRLLRAHGESSGDSGGRGGRGGERRPPSGGAGPEQPDRVAAGAARGRSRAIVRRPRCAGVGAGSGGRGGIQDPGPGSPAGSGWVPSASGCRAVPSEPVPVPPPQPRAASVSGCSIPSLSAHQPCWGKGFPFLAAPLCQESPPAPAAPRGWELGMGSGNRDSAPAVTAPGHGKSQSGLGWKRS